MLYVALLQFITTYFKKQFQKAPLIIINFNVLYVYGIQDVMGENGTRISVFYYWADTCSNYKALFQKESFRVTFEPSTCILNKPIYRMLLPIN